MPGLFWQHRDHQESNAKEGWKKRIGQVGERDAIFPCGKLGTFFSGRRFVSFGEVKNWGRSHFRLASDIALCHTASLSMIETPLNG